MKCSICALPVDQTDIVRFIPNPNRPPYNSRLVEVDLYTTEAVVEYKHISCRIQEKVTAPNYRGM